ncbi:hypothetical protein C4B60_10735 [Jeotgalibacillus proteolyticus]|uniref:Uncharacterized protein n=1 Tax=Jeotgalibacillus proteolyticus TaxID=2082395 RepID=A0A2S5GAP3_9BACL|nr:hypothetical protein C4B60_10735 [Jeotgalibacillus proteolyticus]
MTWGMPNRQLKKVVFGLSEATVKKLITRHQERGWIVKSDIKPHGNGVACLMVYPRKGEVS